jgi:hypothetical protein
MNLYMVPTSTNEKVFNLNKKIYVSSQTHNDFLLLEMMFQSLFQNAYNCQFTWGWNSHVKSKLDVRFFFSGNFFLSCLFQHCPCYIVNHIWGEIRFLNSVYVWLRDRPCQTSSLTLTMRVVCVGSLVRVHTITQSLPEARFFIITSGFHANVVKSPLYCWWQRNL